MDSYANFLFHGLLNDFLPKGKKNNWIKYSFSNLPAVKDAIEAIGIPHPEVDIIRVNKSPANFATLLQPGQNVEVFPKNLKEKWPEPFSLLTEPPLPIRFIVDVHAGKLAKSLRMLGFDTYYDKFYEDKTIARIAESENRVVLTRDIGLLKHKVIKWGYWLRSQHLEEQLAEVVNYYHLKLYFQPFTRCLTCNSPISPVPKEVVWEKLLPKTQLHFQEFYTCNNCHQVFWKGSHYDHMLTFIQKLENK
ncbi:Mut7-C RNAse domain-containing protein [Adhaeribacter aquaticus]|uniref:Mut7-C RNAse domain-containing protein n=1 Tax=Adhaeribacter aquaticus TaxID=299567 RepID=UPI000418FFC6|nr:Mut7-C RNAse domain-containing protein [Adhaeribacter aquaticus]